MKALKRLSFSEGIREAEIHALRAFVHDEIFRSRRALVTIGVLGFLVGPIASTFSQTNTYPWPSSGSVGIGTTTPSDTVNGAQGTLLNVYSAGNTNPLFIGTSGGTSGSGVGAVFGAESNLSVAGSTLIGELVFARFADVTSGQISGGAELFVNNNGANLLAMEILPTGNVGIGTANPTAGLLSISQTIDPGTTPAALSVVVPGVGGGTATSQYGIKVTANGFNNATNVYGIYSNTPQQTSNPAYALYGSTAGIYSNVYGLYAQAMQENLNGFGIAYGVYGSATSYNDAGTDGQTYAGYFTNTASPGAAAVGVYANSTNGVPLVVSTGTTQRMIVLNNGNVGIGTATPQAMLQIVSSAGGAGLTNLLELSYNSSSTADFTLARNGTTGALSIQGNQVGYNNILLAPTSGNVGIGTSSPTYPLSVNGTIQAKEVIVQTGWSDYVFEPGYRVPSLSEVKKLISEQGHLPGMPSAREVAEHGVKTGEMEAKLLAKIEELTLLMIRQDDQLRDLKTENAAIRAQMEAITTQKDLR